MRDLPKVLVIGSRGQIGTVLVEALRARYGEKQVIATDLKPEDLELDPYYRQLDAKDAVGLNAIVKQQGVTQIYLLAAILSAKGEQNPLETWQINMSCLFNCFEVAVANKIERVFYPSSIAVFGPDTPRENTPQNAFCNPSTVYGMSKLAGEHWAAYYHKRYGLDVRSLRYPGIVGYQSLPGGGTTDYAVDIFHQALAKGEYTCFLSANTRLPMMYMADAIRATIELMEAPAANLTIRSGYNLSAMSFTPAEIAAQIQTQLPDFKISYAPDFRQAIADSWTQSIDDTVARQDWNWLPEFDLAAMSADMIFQLQQI